MLAANFCLFKDFKQPGEPKENHIHSLAIVFKPVQKWLNSQYNFLFVVLKSHDFYYLFSESFNFVLFGLCIALVGPKI